MRQGIIAAISTPPGKGGVAIIRLSGDGAVQLIDGMFRPLGGKLFSSYPQRYQVYGELYDGEVLLDDCMATRFERERSYTGEETVELSIHGGILLGQRVLTALFGQGVIPAAPGEFTRTAFLNGRLSLTEVEAIGDLLEAKSDEQLALSSSRSRERLKATIEDIRERLVRTLSSIYARIDYPEEDLGDMTDSEVIESLKDARERLMKLISTYRTGKAINEGITTSLVGKTNVGKSTLYNIIAGEDVAIVTDVEGTTRDLIERTIPLGRILLRISDTAGLRDKSLVDIVERIGIERTRESVLSSELVLALFDLSRPYSKEDDEVIALCQEARGAKVAVLTKSDIEPSLFDESHLSGRFDAVIKVSEKEPDAAISDISSLLDRLFTDEKISTSSDAIVASARQSAALTRAVSFVDSAIEALTLGIPQDAASSDIELALSAIGECDGRVVTDEVTGDIFRRFCVGK